MNLPLGKFVNTKVGDISFGFEATSGSFVIGLIALISPGYGTDGEKNDSSSISVIQYFEIFMNRKLCHKHCTFTQVFNSSIPMSSCGLFLTFSSSSDILALGERFNLSSLDRFLGDMEMLQNKKIIFF